MENLTRTQQKRGKITKGYYETDIFDLKQELPHVSNNSEKERVRKTCCAFANTNGGFLVYGVLDDRTKKPTDRLTGIDTATDFPVQFGSFPQTCHPAVQWNFKNPPLELANKRVIHVIEIPKSGIAPHAIRIGTNWCFPKRTNQGNDDMAHEEIRSSFLGFYEKKLKLQLLLAELKLIESDAKGLIIEETQLRKSHSLITFELRVVDSVLADTYTILTNEHNLLSDLTQLRKLCRIANNKIRLFFGSIGLPMSNKEDLVEAHNRFMKGQADGILAKCSSAQELLNHFLYGQ